MLAGRGCLVLHDYARRDTAALADCDALFHGPGPAVTAALTAGRSAGTPAGRGSASLAAMLDIRRDLLAERGSVLLAQVDLVLGAAETEPDRLIGPAAIQVVFQRHRYLLCHPVPP